MYRGMNRASQKNMQYQLKRILMGFERRRPVLLWNQGLTLDPARGNCDHAVLLLDHEMRGVFSRIYTLISTIWMKAFESDWGVDKRFENLLQEPACHYAKN